MFSLINIFMCSCGVLMCISSSPVESVIYLILTFCGAVVVLFMFHVEFLGLVLIIIYVGAVAVLFLFVIMMLNIKNEEEAEKKNDLVFVVFFLFFFGFFIVTLSNSFPVDLMNKVIVKIDPSVESCFLEYNKIYLNLIGVMPSTPHFVPFTSLDIILFVNKACSSVDSSVVDFFRDILAFYETIMINNSLGIITPVDASITSADYFGAVDMIEFVDITLTSFSLIHIIDDLNNIDVLGQVLFNYYLVCFLLAGIILLIALIGAIVLTLKFNTAEKSQNANRQLARTENFISFFK